MLLGVTLGTVGTAQATGSTDTLYQKLEVLAEIFTYIENSYVDDVAPTDLVYGAAAGALNSLDEHSAFFSPDEFQQLVNTTEGEYAGIGIELEPRDNFVEILTVFEKSPAARAGILPGDLVVAIDAKTVEDKNFDEIKTMLRGPAGTKVGLHIRRESEERDWTFTLVRSWIRVAPIKSKKLNHGIGYVQIRSFSRGVAEEMRAHLRKLPRAGLIIDLRDNPGGLFDEAVSVADLFLRDGVIVTSAGRDGLIVDEQKARNGKDEPSYPIALLVNRNSASASEVLAGALKDTGRARLFGERTYGKGSVQTIVDLSDGSGLKMTIARYKTPGGHQIDGKGIEPHVKAGAKEDLLSLAEKWTMQATDKR
jgi:carboxyl-terminal processing protease